MECKVIYTGKANPNFDKASQVALLGDILGCEPEKAEKVRQMQKPVVIKKTDKLSAVKLVKAMKDVGLEALAKTANETPPSQQISRLESQVTSLTEDVEALKKQLSTLSEYVDEHVQKKDIDIDIGDSSLLGSSEHHPEHAYRSKLVDDVADLDLDNDESSSPKFVPILVALIILIAAGLLVWLYFEG